MIDSRNCSFKFHFRVYSQTLKIVFFVLLTCEKIILTVPIVRNKMAIGLGINTDAKIFEICYEIFLNFKFNKLDEEEKNWRDPLFCS